MLVLSRKLEEKIRIGDDITISILRVTGNTVRVGIDAPRSVRVVRGELPRHEPVASSSGANLTSEDGASESLQGEEGSTSVDIEMPEVAASALRQFLAKRSGRRNRSPKVRHAGDRALATPLTRSA